MGEDLLCEIDFAVLPLIQKFEYFELCRLAHADSPVQDSRSMLLHNTLVKFIIGLIHHKGLNLANFLQIPQRIFFRHQKRRSLDMS